MRHNLCGRSRLTAYRASNLRDERHNNLHSDSWGIDAPHIYGPVGHFVRLSRLKQPSDFLVTDGAALHCLKVGIPVYTAPVHDFTIPSSAAHQARYACCARSLPGRDAPHSFPHTCNNLVKGPLRHGFNPLQRGIQIQNWSKAESPLGKIHRADLTGKRPRRQTVQQAAFKQQRRSSSRASSAASLMPSLLVSAIGCVPPLFRAFSV